MFSLFHNLKRNIQEGGRGSVRQGGGGWQSKMAGEAGRPEEGTQEWPGQKSRKDRSASSTEGRREGMGLAMDSL